MFKKLFSLCLLVFLCLLMFCPLVSQIHAADMYLNPTAGYAIMGDSTATGNVMTIRQNGNVGIGTTGPDNKLDVNGILEVGTGTRGVQLFSTAADNFTLMSQTNTPNTNWNIGTGNGSGGLDTAKPYITSNGYISLMSGNVGIGTTGPTTKLHTVGTTYTATSLSEFFSSTAFRVQPRSDVVSSIFIASIGAGGLTSPIGIQGAYSTSGTNDIGLQPFGGNVGIGTTAPGATLDVNGTINATTITGAYSPSTLTVTGNSYLATTSGNVGIGTTVPTQKLEIKDASAHLGLEINSAAAYSGSLRFSEAGSAKWLISSRNTFDAPNYRLGFFVNGVSEVMTLLNGGNVGIGTTGPNRELHIYKSVGSGIDVGMQIQNAGPGGANIQIVAGNTGIASEPKLFRIYDGTANRIGIASDGSVILQPTSGNVGIGTAGPGAPLEVFKDGSASDATGGGLILSRYHVGIDYRASSIFHRYITGQGDTMLFSVSDSGNPYISGTDALDSRVKMVINSTGNVGIGTTNPGNKLEVSGGNIKIATAYSKLIFDNDLRYIQGTRSGADYLTIVGHSYAAGIQLGFADASNPGGGYPFYPTVTITSFSGGTGNVGIGTTSPAEKLHVQGASQTPVSLKVQGNQHHATLIVDNSISSSYGTVRGIYFKEDGVSKGHILNYSSNYGGYNNEIEFNANEGFFDFRSSSVVYPDVIMRLQNTGNVGIGTTDTSYGKFTVYSSGANEANGQISLLSSQSPNRRFNIRNDGTYLSITSNDNLGNVGIGTTSPDRKLEVAGGNIGLDQDYGLKFHPSTGSSGDYLLSMRSGGNWPVRLSLCSDAGTSRPFEIGYYTSDDITQAWNAKFHVNPINGNVGIGTTAPVAKLQVEGPVALGYTTEAYITGTSIHEARLYTTLNSGAAFPFLENGNLVIQPRVSSSIGSNIIFATNNGANVDSRMAITASGNVGIGTTGPSTILAVVQSSATDPIADAWTTYSSKRWKTNIAPLTGALTKVQALQGVSFEWKADGKHDIGMIAEDVGKVIPEVVAYEENGADAKSLDYARLTAVLVEAVKEQQVQIEELKREIEELKRK